MTRTGWSIKRDQFKATGSRVSSAGVKARLERGHARLEAAGSRSIMFQWTVEDLTPGRGRSTLVATLASVVGVAVALVADALAGAVLPDSAGWVQEEAGLWLAAGLTVIVAVGWLLLREPRRAARSA